MNMKSHGAGRVAAVLTVLLFSCGFAQRVGQGTKLLLTDLDSKTILGYGQVLGNELELSLSRGTRAFALLLIQPDGSVTTFQGERSGGVLRLESGGRRLSLTALLRRAGISFTLREVRPGAPLTAPGQDEEDRAADGGGDDHVGEVSSDTSNGSDHDDSDDDHSGGGDDDHSGHGGDEDGSDDDGGDDHSGHGGDDDGSSDDGGR